jgi:hypothetical protein
MITMEPSTTTNPSPRPLSSSSGVKKLTSPKLARQMHNGPLDDKPIRTGVVEKLVTEFQLYYNENKETPYGIQDTSTTSPQSRHSLKDEPPSVSPKSLHQSKVELAEYLNNVSVTKNQHA